jgi:hypothetical protein
MDTTHVSWRKATYSAQNSSCVEVAAWRKTTHSQANSDCVEVAAWRKATHSAQNSDCVEVGVSRESAATALCLVRDSKNPTGPSLAFPPTTWHTFLTTVKTGDLGHLG